MKAINKEMRKEIIKWAELSNRDAIEGVLACMVCLMLTCALGIPYSLDTAIYLILRSYFAVFISAIGIRYIWEYMEYCIEYYILVLLVSAFIVESGYVIIDEFAMMFCKWLGSSHLLFLFFFIFIWKFY